jgi:hypothetical protein
VLLLDNLLIENRSNVAKKLFAITQKTLLIGRKMEAQRSKKDSTGPIKISTYRPINSSLFNDLFGKIYIISSYFFDCIDKKISRKKNNLCLEICLTI